MNFVVPKMLTRDHVSLCRKLISIFPALFASPALYGQSELALPTLVRANSLKR